MLVRHCGTGAQSMTKHLFIGGLVAAGLDRTGAYLLAVSHSGRGVFSTAAWEQVARDPDPAYPKDGYAIGIGPIQGERIPVTEKNYDTGSLRFSSPDGRLSFEYDSGTLIVTDVTA
jgi:hypothetical protein